MLSEVMAHHGLAQSFHDAGWFETEHHRQVARMLAWSVVGMADWAVGVEQPAPTVPTLQEFLAGLRTA